MTISQSDGPLTAKLNAFKAKKAAETKRRAERKGIRRGWLREPHASCHSGVATEAYREGFDAIDWGHGKQTRDDIQGANPPAD